MPDRRRARGLGAGGGQPRRSSRNLLTRRTMKLHLSKPGGHREGPFTIEQIKSDLAARKYHDTDYWAWHEGLSDWVPLHSVAELSAEAVASKAAGDASEPVERAGGGDTV